MGSLLHVSPIAHDVMDGVHYRMYAEHVGGVYSLHVDPLLVRRYTAENLPNPIKEAIAFINSFEFVYSPNHDSAYKYWGNVYENWHHKKLHMIGWRTINHHAPAIPTNSGSREFYIIVVTREFLEDLRG